MTPEEYRAIRERVRSVAERIQPLLAPVAGLSKRNASAHAWLGIRELFGDEWRARAEPASVLRFLDWIERHPNADYRSFTDTPRLRDGSFSERLF